MYFRIDKQSNLGQQITALMQRIHLANKQMFEVAAKLSDCEKPLIIIRRDYMCGVFDSIEFKSKPGKEWASVSNRNLTGHYYHPSTRECSRATSEIVKAWNSVQDKIKVDDFNALFGLKSGNAGTFTWYVRPQMNTYPGCYILSVPGPWADTVEKFPTDMQEILESEARLLEKEYTAQNRQHASS